MNRFLFSISIVLVVLFSVQLTCIGTEPENAKAVLMQSMEPVLSGDGAIVSEPLSIQKIEKKELEEIRGKDCPQVPFGFSNKKWEKFKSLYKDGDVILYFRTNNETWQKECGREGYAIIRGKVIIDTLFTLIN